MQKPRTFLLVFAVISIYPRYIPIYPRNIVPRDTPLKKPDVEIERERERPYFWFLIIKIYIIGFEIIQVCIFVFFQNT